MARTINVDNKACATPAACKAEGLLKRVVRERTGLETTTAPEAECCIRFDLRREPRVTAVLPPNRTAAPGTAQRPRPANLT